MVVVKTADGKLAGAGTPDLRARRRARARPPEAVVAPRINGASQTVGARKSLAYRALDT